MVKIYFHIVILIISINSSTPRHIGDIKLLEDKIIEIQKLLADLQQSNPDNTKYQENNKDDSIQELDVVNKKSKEKQAASASKEDNDSFERNKDYTYQNNVKNPTKAYKENQHNKENYNDDPELLENSKFISNQNTKEVEDTSLSEENSGSIEEENGNINDLTEPQAKTIIAENLQEEFLNHNFKHIKESNDEHGLFKKIKIAPKPSKEDQAEVSSEEEEEGIPIEDNNKVLPVSYDFNKPIKGNNDDEREFANSKLVNKQNSIQDEIKSSTENLKTSKSSESNSFETDDASGSKDITKKYNIYPSNDITSYHDRNRDHQGKGKFNNGNVFNNGNNIEESNSYMKLKVDTDDNNHEKADQDDVKVQGDDDDTEIAQVVNDKNDLTSFNQKFQCNDEFCGPKEADEKFKINCNTNSCELETDIDAKDKNEDKNMLYDKGVELKYILTAVDNLKNVLKRYNQTHEYDRNKRCRTMTCKLINERREKEYKENQALIEDLLEDLEEALFDKFRNNINIQNIYASYKGSTRAHHDHLRDIDKQDIDEVLHDLEEAMINRLNKGDHNIYQLQCRDGLCELDSNDPYLSERLEQYMKKRSRELSLRCDDAEDRCDFSDDEDENRKNQERFEEGKESGNILRSRCKGTNCGINNSERRKVISYVDDYAANIMAYHLEDLLTKQKKKVVMKVMRYVKDPNTSLESLSDFHLNKKLARNLAEVKILYQVKPLKDDILLKVIMKELKEFHDSEVKMHNRDDSAILVPQELFDELVGIYGNEDSNFKYRI